MRSGSFILGALSWALLASSAAAQPSGHPALRFSCMSPLPPGEPTPWVDAEVPYAIESMHPGHTIQVFTGFALPGVSLFEIVGGRRTEGTGDRYASVEGVDEAGAVLTGRALFVRYAATTSTPAALARAALGMLMHRSGQWPLGPRDAESVHELVRDRLAWPRIDAGELRFWVRNREGMPYASEVRVELATGIVSGDPG